MILIGALLAVTTVGAQELEFESAADAVVNMRVGWNLGNTLDAHSASTPICGLNGGHKGEHPTMKQHGASL